MQIGGDPLLFEHARMIRPASGDQGKGRRIFTDDVHLLLPKLRGNKPQDADAPRQSP